MPAPEGAVPVSRLRGARAHRVRVAAAAHAARAAPRAAAGTDAARTSDVLRGHRVRRVADAPPGVALRRLRCAQLPAQLSRPLRLLPRAARGHGRAHLGALTSAYTSARLSASVIARSRSSR